MTKSAAPRIDEGFVVEMNPDFAQASDVATLPNGGQIAMTPPIGEDYWVARVKLYRNQAILCFPKFFTIGCGFALEEDWNTNLPLSEPAERIYSHIKHNKKFAQIADADCVKAIQLLQQAVLPILEKKRKAAHDR